MSETDQKFIKEAPDPYLKSKNGDGKITTIEPNKIRDAKGHFITGSGGRPKGTPNKSTAELKNLVVSLLKDNSPRFTKVLGKLEGKEYTDTVLKLMEYVIPKQRHSEVEEVSLVRIIVQNDTDTGNNE